ncbi:hypothetical protein FPOAC2_03634 [Fusarium poae]
MRQTPLSEHPVADGQMAGGIVEKTNYRLLNSTCLIAWESTNSTYVAAWDLVLATTKVVKAQAAEAQMFYHHLDHVIRMYKIVKLTIWHTNEAAMELWLTPSALVRTWRQRQTIWVSRKGAELIISRTLIQDSRMSRASDEKVDRVAVWLNRAELATITIARTIYLGMSMGLALRRILHGIRLCRYQLDFRGDAFRRALQLAGKKSS